MKKQEPFNSKLASSPPRCTHTHSNNPSIPGFRARREELSGQVKRLCNANIWRGSPKLLRSNTLKEKNGNRRRVVGSAAAYLRSRRRGSAWRSHTSRHSLSVVPSSARTAWLVVCLERKPSPIPRRECCCTCGFRRKRSGFVNNSEQ